MKRIIPILVGGAGLLGVHLAATTSLNLATHPSHFIPHFLYFSISLLSAMWLQKQANPRHFITFYSAFSGLRLFAGLATMLIVAMIWKAEARAFAVVLVCAFVAYTTLETWLLLRSLKN